MLGHRISLSHFALMCHVQVILPGQRAKWTAELRHQSKGKQTEKWVDLGLQTSWHGCFLNRRKVGVFSTLSASDVVRLWSFARAPLATTKVFNPQRIPEPLHKSTWGTVHGSEVSTVSAHCRSQDGSSQPNQSCWRS